MTQTVYEVARDLKALMEKKDPLSPEDIATIKRAADRLIWEHDRNRAVSDVLLNELERNRNTRRN